MADCFTGLVLGVFVSKAAPRFELGVKVLQTSALPLGYAADPVFHSEIYHSKFFLKCNRPAEVFTKNLPIPMSEFSANPIYPKICDADHLHFCLKSPIAGFFKANVMKDV